MNTLQKLGKRVRMLRRRKDLTQAKLAEKCDLSVNFIALLERGKTAPSIGTLEKLAANLDVSLSGLFDFDPPPQAATDSEQIVKILQRVRNKKDLETIGKIINAFLAS